MNTALSVCLILMNDERLQPFIAGGILVKNIGIETPPNSEFGTKTVLLQHGLFVPNSISPSATRPYPWDKEP